MRSTDSGGTRTWRNSERARAAARARPKRSSMVERSSAIGSAPAPAADRARMTVGLRPSEVPPRARAGAARPPRRRTSCARSFGHTSSASGVSTTTRSSTPTSATRRAPGCRPRSRGCRSASGVPAHRVARRSRVAPAGRRRPPSSRRRSTGSARGRPPPRSAALEHARVDRDRRQRADTPRASARAAPRASAASSGRTTRGSERAQLGEDALDPPREDAGVPEHAPLGDQRLARARARRASRRRRATRARAADVPARARAPAGCSRSRSRAASGGTPSVTSASVALRDLEREARASRGTRRASPIDVVGGQHDHRRVRACGARARAPRARSPPRCSGPPARPGGVRAAAAAARGAPRARVARRRHDDVRRVGTSGAHARDRLREQAPPSGDREQLLRDALAAPRPEAGPGAAGHHDGVTRHCVARSARVGLYGWRPRKARRCRRSILDRMRRERLTCAS